MKIKSLLGCTLLTAFTLISCNNDDNVGAGFPKISDDDDFYAGMV